MVTRTITETVCEVMGVNVDTADVFTMSLTISGTYGDDTNAMLKECVKVYENAPNKFVKVISYSTRETLYGMPESDFMVFAKILPPRKATND